MPPRDDWLSQWHSRALMHGCALKADMAGLGNYGAGQLLGRLLCCTNVLLCHVTLCALTLYGMCEYPAMNPRGEVDMLFASVSCGVYSACVLSCLLLCVTWAIWIYSYLSVDMCSIKLFARFVCPIQPSSCQKQ